MNILVRPRIAIQQAISFEQSPNPFKTDWALISIYSLGDGPLLNEENTKVLFSIGCIQNLSMRFADLDPKYFSVYKKEYPDKAAFEEDIFNEQHAKRIITFLDNLKTDTLIVHCAAGISRSGAVGLFCCRYLKQNEKLFWTENRTILPQNHVLETLMHYSKINLPLGA